MSDKNCLQVQVGPLARDAQLAAFEALDWPVPRDAVKERIFYSYTRKHFLFYLGATPVFTPSPNFWCFLGGNCYTLLARSRAQCESARSAERNQRLLSHVTFGYARAWARFTQRVTRGKWAKKSTENINFQFFMPNGTLNHALLHVARLFALT